MMDKTKLNKILENHNHWLKRDCVGWEDMRANLAGADLSNADLRGADLTDAILTNADLRGVKLANADLRDAKNLPFIPYYCPESGSFIGYKKASNYIVELEILKDAKRLSGFSRKCRCDKAKVLRILNYDKSISDVKEVNSDYDNTFIYKVGEIVSVNDFNEDRWDDWDSRGINFFINFQEAVNY